MQKLRMGIGALGLLLIFFGALAVIWCTDVGMGKRLILTGMVMLGTNVVLAFWSGIKILPSKEE